MSRRPVGSMLGKPHRDQMALNRQNQGTMAAMHNYEQYPVGPDAPLTSRFLAHENNEQWKWPERKDGTRREGKQYRTVYREPIGALHHYKDPKDGKLKTRRAGSKFVSKSEYERRRAVAKEQLERDIENRKKRRRS